jgi:hypothetical protein
MLQMASDRGPSHRPLCALPLLLPAAASYCLLACPLTKLAGRDASPKSLPSAITGRENTACRDNSRVSRTVYERRPSCGTGHGLLFGFLLLQFMVSCTGINRCQGLTVMVSRPLMVMLGCATVSRSGGVVNNTFSGKLGRI